MKTEFVLRIKVGNDATLGDVNLGDIIEKVANDLRWVGITDNRSYNVRDFNGNVVGHYGRYTSEEE